VCGFYKKFQYRQKTMNSEALPLTSCLKVTSDLDLISTVAEWFEQFNQPPVPPRLWQEGQIALIEGFTNAVRHAHQHLSPTTPVEIDAKISSETLQISIWDQGDAYDIEFAFAQISQLIHEPNFDPLEREAQWGSIMLLKLRDEYRWQILYQRQNERNCLHIAKTLSSI
jgi:serine/threonine-protein kinase RsbW